MNREGQDYYYLSDSMGTVYQVVDANGNLVNSYDYNAWGEIRESQTTETVANPFRWQTKPWDEEIGLYYSRARYYEAGSGRFVSVDPLEGLSSGGRYSWPSCNPVMTRDPTGMDSVAGSAGLKTLTDLTMLRHLRGSWRRMLRHLKGGPVPASLGKCWERCMGKTTPGAFAQWLASVPAGIDFLLWLLGASAGAVAGLTASSLGMWDMTRGFQCLGDCWDDPCSW